MARPPEIPYPSCQNLNFMNFASIATARFALKNWLNTLPEGQRWFTAGERLDSMQKE